jgi:hypothetical protein
MKNLRILPLVLSLLFLFGCDLIDKIKGLETFEIEATISDYWTVDISEEDDTKIFDNRTLTSKSDPEIFDHLSNISGYELVSAYILTTSWNTVETDISFTGTVKLGQVTKSVSNLRPYDYMTTPYYLDLTQADLDLISEDLKDHEIEASIDGFVSDKPVNFVIKVSMDMIVEIES